jgi:predicted O-methyltransferase YrrM
MCPYQPIPPFLCGVYSPFQLAKKFLRYYFTASNGKGHGVHSPFVYDFIIHVLNDRNRYECYEKIEAARKDLSTDNTVITVEDFGAGSRKKATNLRVVSAIAASALKPKKFGQLMFRVARYYKSNRILELGTSLGITSSYLASAHEKVRLDTLEGAPAIAAIAKNNFENLGLKNTRLHVGNFDETLSPLLNELKQIDLAFIDGNHRCEPTVRYFRQLLPVCHNDTILIFDDIHWSEEMEQAWAEIKKDEQVMLTIDLFFIGLVFFKKEFKVKQDFAIRF